MDKQTRQALQDLAAARKLLEQCQARVLRVPGRFKNLYLSVPAEFMTGLRVARAGVDELAQQLTQMQNLPPYCAAVSSSQKSKRR